MLTYYLSCYKLNNKPILFEEEEKSLKLKNCQIFIVIKVLGHSNICVHKFQKEKKEYFSILYTCIPEKVSAYHTGSVYTVLLQISGIIRP